MGRPAHRHCHPALPGQHRVGGVARRGAGERLSRAMPPVARWFIRTALVYLVAALLLGVALMLRLVLNLPPAIGALQPVYFHLLLVGWVTQLIFGVVFWMFPKHSSQQPRGSQALGWATYGLLNAGLLL